MIKSLFLHPLAPTLILTLGSLCYLPVRRVRQVRGISTAWIGLATLLVAGLDLLYLRAPSRMDGLPGVADLRWVWQPLTVSGSALEWHLDRWNWLGALLVLIVGATALALQGDEAVSQPTMPRQSRTLLLAAAALAFVFSNNIVTLASCWVLLDAALAYSLRPSEAPEVAARAWSILSLAGMFLLVIMTLLGEGRIGSTLQDGSFTRSELTMLWLVALVRASVYPFHIWLGGEASLQDGDRMVVHLMVPVTGLWLMARVHQLAGPGWLHRQEWGALGALALLGSALAAWTARDRATTWRWIAINRASLTLAAAFLADSAGPSALAWPIVAFALGTALLGLGLAIRERWGWAWPVWLGSLATWGLPGTPGFLARSALVLPAQTPAALPMFLLMMVAETLLVAALWQLVEGNRTARQTLIWLASSLPGKGDRLRPLLRFPAMLIHRRVSQSVSGRNAPAVAPGPDRADNPARQALAQQIAVAALLVISILALGLAPAQLTILAGLTPSAGAATTLWQSILAARRSVWVGLLISGAAGIGFGMLNEQIFAGMRGWQKGLVGLVGLEWIYLGLQSAGKVVSAGLAYFARLGEGEGYLGWLALAALLLWVLLRA